LNVGVKQKAGNFPPFSIDKKSIIRYSQNTNKEKIMEINAEKIYNGFLKIFKVDVKHQSLDNKTTLQYTREVIVRKDAVVIVPWHKETNTVVLVKQMRVPIEFSHGNGIVLDAPAGVVENDDVLQTAFNELDEEVDIKKEHVVQMHNLGYYYPSAGACSEKVHLLVAEINQLPTTKFKGLVEENEDIEICIFDLNDLIGMIGKTFNAPTASIGIMKISNGSLDD
jgi:ADP-ribose pyrophosphatase